MRMKSQDSQTTILMKRKRTNKWNENLKVIFFSVVTVLITALLPTSSAREGEADHARRIGY